MKKLNIDLFLTHIINSGFRSYYFESSGDFDLPLESSIIRLKKNRDHNLIDIFYISKDDNQDYHYTNFKKNLPNLMNIIKKYLNYAITEQQQLFQQQIRSKIHIKNNSLEFPSSITIDDHILHLSYDKYHFFPSIICQHKHKNKKMTDIIIPIKEFKYIDNQSFIQNKELEKFTSILSKKDLNLLQLFELNEHLQLNIENLNSNNKKIKI